jgi:hypothetical protein
MKLSKEVKNLIDKWFDNKTPEEVDYILKKYTPNNKISKEQHNNVITGVGNKSVVSKRSDWDLVYDPIRKNWFRVSELVSE